MPELPTSPQEHNRAANGSTLRHDDAATQNEQRLIRRMQMMMNLVMQTIAQDGGLTLDEASQMIADARCATLAMFPGKELAYDLIWKPRFQRLMRERFRLN